MLNTLDYIWPGSKYKSSLVHVSNLFWMCKSQQIINNILRKKLLSFTCTSLLHEALEVWRQIAFLIDDVINSLIFSWDLLVLPICTICIQQNSTYILTPFTVNKIGLKSGRFCSGFIRFYSLIEKHTGSPLLMWILGKKQFPLLDSMVFTV